MISEEDKKNLPDGENTPGKRTDKIWDLFGKKENGELVFIILKHLWACHLPPTV